jgi:hypothetical protein
MKVVDYALANAALIPSLDDIRPVRGFVLSELLTVLEKRYGFPGKPNPASAPKFQVPRPDGSGMMIAQGPLAFENGSIDIRSTTVRIPRLELAPDLSMVVVHTSTTEEGDEILADMAGQLEVQLGFRDVTKASRMRYGSNIVFEFEAGVDDTVRLLADLEQIVSPLLQGASGIKLDAKWDRISFSFDPLDIPPSKTQQPVTFLIERRTGRPFSDRRWFSSGPVRTRDHVRALEQIEDIFKRQKS